MTICGHGPSDGRATLAAALIGAMALPALAQEGEFVPGPYIELLAECYGAAETLDDRRACIGEASSICQDEEPQGRTTRGAVRCIGIEADAWDVVLEGEYQLTTEWARQADAAERESFPEFALREERLRAAQDAWSDYRDEACALEYALWGSGSMRSVAGALCQLEMIAERAVELRAMREEF